MVDSQCISHRRHHLSTATGHHQLAGRPQYYLLTSSSNNIINILSPSNIRLVIRTHCT